eukprot:TRINITY_DN24399_c0_g1_i1.p1 TRINITY_DN24399_c0_g1~~TRINITY_DN24399_c0_g1_i1.p1  ORF type:complete len:625 (-),score=105.37 TRINITY_DN24399_c0_g1_i1:101-1975(-)
MAESHDGVRLGRSTFMDRLPEVEATIARSAFIALDFEFSGLALTKADEAHMMDTFETRYAKLKRSVESFVPLQLGICCFEKTAPGAPSASETSKAEGSTLCATAYSVHCFNGTLKGSRLWTCQPDSLHFLSQNGFDFNTCFSQGVSYLTRSEEKQRAEANAAYFARIAEREEDAESDIKLTKAWDIELVDKLKAIVTSDLMQTPMDDASLPKHVVLEPLSGYQRRLAYQELQKLCPNGCLIVSKQEADNTDLKGCPKQRCRVTRYASREATVKAKTAETDALKEAAASKLKGEVGIRQLLEAIIQHRVPTVLHNGAFDIMHLISSFIDPLPASVHTFAEFVHGLFPVLLDTKQLIGRHTAKLLDMADGTGLGELFWIATTQGESTPETAKALSLNMEPGVVCRAGHAMTGDAAMAHDAAYDAYMTGVVFARALCALRKQAGDKTLDALGECFASAEALKRVLTEEFTNLGDAIVNRLCMMRMREPLGFPGPNKSPSRSTVLHVSGFPSNFTHSDIKRIFSRFLPPAQPSKGEGKNGKQGGKAMDLRFYWWGDSACLVDLQSEDACKEALAASAAEAGESVGVDPDASSVCISHLRLLTWQEFEASTVCAQDQSQEPSAKRQRCS